MSKSKYDFNLSDAVCVVDPNAKSGSVGHFGYVVWMSKFDNWIGVNSSGKSTDSFAQYPRRWVEKTKLSTIISTGRGNLEVSIEKPWGCIQCGMKAVKHVHLCERRLKKGDIVEVIKPHDLCGLPKHRATVVHKENKFGIVGVNRSGKDTDGVLNYHVSKIKKVKSAKLGKSMGDVVIARGSSEVRVEKPWGCILGRLDQITNTASILSINFYRDKKKPKRKLTPSLEHKRKTKLVSKFVSKVTRMGVTKVVSNTRVQDSLDDLRVYENLGFILVESKLGAEYSKDLIPVKTTDDTPTASRAHAEVDSLIRIKSALSDDELISEVCRAVWRRIHPHHEDWPKEFDEGTQNIPIELRCAVDTTLDIMRNPEINKE